MANFKKLYERGFTVVELLIVIVVIGILAALVLNSFAGVQAKARDTQRKTDINAIATQLEACYNDKCSGSYPTLAQLTDESANGFLDQNMQGFDRAALRDSNNNLIQSDAVDNAGHQYQYIPYESDGTTVCTTVDQCKKFVLRTFQEQGATYEKRSLN